MTVPMKRTHRPGQEHTDQAQLPLSCNLWATVMSQRPTRLLFPPSWPSFQSILVPNYSEPQEACQGRN